MFCPKGYDAKSSQKLPQESLPYPRLILRQFNQRPVFPSPMTNIAKSRIYDVKKVSRIPLLSNPEKQNVKGSRLLDLLYFYDCKKISKLHDHLQKDKSSVNIRDKEGYSPVWYAANAKCNLEGRYTILKLLFENGAYVDHSEFEEGSALHHIVLTRPHYEVDTEDLCNTLTAFLAYGREQDGSKLDANKKIKGKTALEALRTSPVNCGVYDRLFHEFQVSATLLQFGTKVEPDFFENTTDLEMIQLFYTYASPEVRNQYMWDFYLGRLLHFAKKEEDQKTMSLSSG